MDEKEFQRVKADLEKLRNILAEEIEKLRDGQTTVANVNAVTNATGKILSTLKKELKEPSSGSKPLRKKRRVLPD